MAIASLARENKPTTGSARPILRHGVPQIMHSSSTVLPVAFDIGFNTGDDTALLLLQAYRVVAVEANPLLVESRVAASRCSTSPSRMTPHRQAKLCPFT